MKLTNSNVNFDMCSKWNFPADKSHNDWTQEKQMIMHFSTSRRTVKKLLT